METPSNITIISSVKAINILFNQIDHQFTSEQGKDKQLPSKQLNQKISQDLELFQNLLTFLASSIGISQEHLEHATCQIRSFSQMMELPEQCKKKLASQPKYKRPAKRPRKNFRGPYRSYTVEEKTNVVYLHKIGMSFASISKQLEIPQKNVVRWCRSGLFAERTEPKIELHEEPRSIPPAKVEKQGERTAASKIKSSDTVDDAQVLRLFQMIKCEEKERV